MQFMVSIYELLAVDLESTYRREFPVDYVRAYQPESSY